MATGKKVARAKKVDTVWCSHCGRQQDKLKTKGFADVKLPKCPGCGLKAVSIQSLLLAADITGDDIRRCPTCATQCENKNFCFACGTPLQESLAGRGGRG